MFEVHSLLLLSVSEILCICHPVVVVEVGVCVSVVGGGQCGYMSG